MAFQAERMLVGEGVPQALLAKWSSQMWFKRSRRPKSHQREYCNPAGYSGWSGLSVAMHGELRLPNRLLILGQMIPRVSDLDLGEVQWRECI